MPEQAPKEAPWHLKYRPDTLGGVVGQPEAVKAIRAAIAAKGRQHTHFLTGPSGTGKTTLARIMADGFGCSPSQRFEVDAASNSGIDDMRAVMSSLEYSAFGAQPNKAYIIDECHRLSAQAWDSLLKSTEEPPAHAFFFFCSTAPAKIPKTMLTRGPTYELRPVRRDDLLDLLEGVCEAEGVSAPPEVLDAVARACEGSPRSALVMLAQVRDCRTGEEAAEMLAGFAERPEVIDLCRLMVRGSLRWPDVQRALLPLKDLDPEGVRIPVALYLSAVLEGCKEGEAPRLLDMLAAFSKPFNRTDKLSPAFLAFGEFVDFGRGR